MKKFLLSIAAVLCIHMLNAQAPQQINYQAVARDTSGAVLANTSLTVQFDIHAGSISGTIVYTETHTGVMTNQFGLFNVAIGSITPVSPSLFGAGLEFLEVSVDAGTGLTSMGTTQLLAVPYALYAETSGTAGPSGPTGPAGPTGVAGTNGATGAQGPTGTNGATGTMGATGTAGSNGFNCWDTNQNGVNDAGEDINGDSQYDVLDCQGATGPAGPTGAVGTNGATGAQGPTGTAGTNGATGAQGPTGTAGTNGATGVQGPTGSAGTNGATGVQGPTGTAGTNGATGVQGPTGTAGTNGATGLQGPTGTAGTNGATGSQGPSGPTGPTGDAMWLRSGNDISLQLTTDNVAIGAASGPSKLYVTQNSASVDAAQFYSSGTGNSIYAQNSGSTGNTIYAYSTGGARAGFFQTTNSSTIAHTIQSEQYGMGRAGHFEISNGSNTNSALYAATNGSGYAFRTYTNGSGYGGYFEIQNSFNLNSAVYATSSGNGNTIASFNTGTGRAAYFQNNTTGNPVLETFANAGGTSAAFMGGNVGIGTNTPAYQLQLYSTSGASVLSIASAAASTSSLFLGSTAQPGLGRIDYTNSTNTLSFTTNSTSRMVINASGNVGIAAASPTAKLQVTGNVAIPASNTFRYLTPKTKKYKVGIADMHSANPSVYEIRVDDGFSSATVNGLNQLWLSTGTAGTVGYCTAPVHLPDSAVITALAAQLVKNGGSLQSIVELYRSDGNGYLNNTSQLIGSCTTTSSGGIIAYVSASSINTSYNVVDNSNYTYFIRWSGEQATQNVRFVNATITYQQYRDDY